MRITKNNDDKNNKLTRIDSHTLRAVNEERITKPMMTITTNKQ